MGGRGSGGFNAIPIADHLARGTFRPARHAARANPPPAAPVSRGDRAATLAGLGPLGRKLVARLLDTFDGWDAASLHTLRCYGLSCEKLAALEHDDDGRRAETRINLMLLKALQLERPR